MMIASGSSVSPTMDRLVSRCQVLAGFLEAPPEDLLDAIALTAAAVPLDELGVPERMLAGMLLVRMLSHWAEHSRVTRSLIAEPLLELGTLPLSVTMWRGRWIGLLQLCRRTLRAPVESLVRDSDPRADMLLATIQMRFRDPTLCLSDIARAAHVSPWQASRLLARETGKGFIVHLREHRVTAARNMLTDTLLSVKEIADRVGYSSTRQLSRDFKRLCDTTPNGFRSRRPS